LELELQKKYIYLFLTHFI